ncbi:MAG TPA: sugar phosphate isomerase/epimerase [Candidatus Aphodomonas merdavium]|nr:sugar phosphate isomerase/epimerase [Candidatus Aphodomonas merdavium]
MSPSIRLEQLACMNMMYRQYSLEYFLSTAQRIGYCAATFWAGPPHFILDGAGYEDVKALRRRFAAHGIRCTSFITPALLPPNQVAIEGAEHIEDTYRYFCNGVRVAEDMGASVMSINSGYGLRTHSRDDAWKRSCEMLRRLAAFASEHGVTITMESMRAPECNLAYNLQEVQRILAEVAHPGLKAMVDTGAMNIAGETVWDWFAAFGSEIVNTHFVDAVGSAHLAWGDGRLPLDDILRCLAQYGYTGPLGLEVGGAQYESNPAAADERMFRNLLRYVG